jgi:hypothetical protein
LTSDSGKKNLSHPTIAADFGASKRWSTVVADFVAEQGTNSRFQFWARGTIKLPNCAMVCSNTCELVQVLLESDAVEGEYKSAQINKPGF